MATCSTSAGMCAHASPGHTQCKGASRCKCRCKPQTLHPHLDAIKLLASASAVMQMQLSEPASASAVMQMQIELHLRCASKMQGPWQGPWVPHPGARGPAYFAAQALGRVVRGSPASRKQLRTPVKRGSGSHRSAARVAGGGRAAGFAR